MVFLLALVLYLVPGLALLVLLYPNHNKFDWIEKFVLSAGISLSIYPLIILWTNLLGLQLGFLYAWLPSILGAIYLLIYFIHNNRFFPIRTWPRFTITPPHLILLGLFGLIIFTRLWAIRDLDLPMWGDSVQHTMITQLLLENQGLFNSWEPYARLQTLTYHFGFHSLAANLAWLSGVPAAKGVLFGGQFLNVLAALAVYPLVMRISRNAWAGVVAILLAGLMFNLPMFYINWGRYTQLAGIVIMATLVYFLWDTFENDRLNWALVSLCWVTFSGLALTHYRVLIFSIIFPLAWILLNFRRSSILQFITRLSIIGVGSIIFCLPWLLHTVSGKLDLITLNQLKAPASQTADYARQTTSFGNILNYLPIWAWLTLPLGLAWGFWKRNSGIVLICLWWLLIIFAANPQWLNLPGAGVITTFAVMITLYFPASIILGIAAGWIIGKIVSPGKISQENPSAARLHRWYGLSLVIILFGLAAIFAKARMEDPDPVTYAVALPPDLQAFHWIKENLPSDAGFLVNSFFAYGDSALVGSDGGWWLPLLTKLETSLPPLLYTTEKGPFPDYANWVNDLPRMIQERGINDSQVLAELQNRGLSYIYIGQRQGLLNSPEPLVDPDDLLSSPSFIPIYHQDQVWIFEIAELPL